MHRMISDKQSNKCKRASYDNKMKSKKYHTVGTVQ